MLLGRYNAVMGSANSSCSSTYYSMYNERFDLIPFIIRFPLRNVVPLLSRNFNVTSLVQKDLAQQRYC